MEPWLTYLIASAVLVVASVLVVLLLRLSRAVAEAQKLIASLNEMTPRVDRILAETEQVTQKVNGMADQALAITQKAAGVANPVLDAAGSLSKPLRYITATVAGVQAVMKFFRDRQAQNHQPEDASDGDPSASSEDLSQRLTPRPEFKET